MNAPWLLFEAGALSKLQHSSSQEYVHSSWTLRQMKFDNPWANFNQQVLIEKTFSG